jgi:Flp pilus assembly protein TadG
MLVRGGARRWRGGRSGATAVELAMVAPVFVALLVGELEASRLGMVSQLLTTAAREGCRVAVLGGSSASDVQSRVNAVLSGSGVSVGTVTPTCPSPYAWDTAPGGVAVTVSLSVPYSQVSWLGAPFFLSRNATISASATLSSERP